MINSGHGQIPIKEQATSQSKPKSISNTSGNCGMTKRKGVPSSVLGFHVWKEYHDTPPVKMVAKVRKERS